MGAAQILLVSSDRNAIGAVLDAAQAMERVETRVVDSVARASQVLERDAVDIVVIDLLIKERDGEAAGARDGIDLMLAIRQNLPEVSILAITDMALQQHDREAIKLGVDGFLVKRVQSEHAQFELARVLDVRQLREQNRRLHHVVGQSNGLDQILGTSSEMRQVFSTILRAATSSAPVAIYGESGTGKELIARAVHRYSSQHDGPYISINPSAIPETLLESELFGHVRGAFTGAGQDRTGYIEAAHGGTLFLDEIGDLPLSFQGKFLRVLQSRVLQRIGSTKNIPVNFRLITATSRDMPTEVRERRFRSDLFYRIHVVPIDVPPLRRRASDIPLLAEHFLRKYGEAMGRPIPGFAPGAVEQLIEYPWPGNVRELENVIHRLVALKGNTTTPVTPAELAPLIPSAGRGAAGMSVAAGSAAPMPLQVKPLNEHVHEYVRWAYETLGQNKARTARLLEIDRTTLYRKLRNE